MEDKQLEELGNHIASQLAKNKEFIDGIAKAIMDAPIIDPTGSYIASIPIQNATGAMEKDHASM